MAVNIGAGEQSVERPASKEETPALWQPLQIGNLTIPNRIIDPAKTLLYGRDGILSDRHIAFYRERAMGGVGLMITEQQGVHPVTSGSFRQGCTAWDARAIPKFAEATAAVHEFGSKFIVQLYAPGVHDKGMLHVDNFHPLWAASAVQSNVHHETPMVMSEHHLDELKSGFVRSAKNVVASGADGTELHAAHSYLLSQFLSPYYNKRTDKYGGSVAKRAAYPLEVAEAIRRAVGDDFVMGIRISYDEFLGEDGITPEQSAEHIGMFADSGLFNYFNISGAAYTTLNIAIPSMTLPSGMFAPFAADAKRIVGDRGSVFVVGGIRNLRLANEIVSSGSADAVAMSRAHLADAAIVRKTLEGREREVIQCVGTNVCAGRLWNEREVICSQNPITGREAKWGEGTLDVVVPSDTKSVLVIGGGMAGMKFASVAAARGHHVTLVEKSHELGGHLKVIQKLPTRAGWAVAVDNMRRAMENSSVEILLDTELTIDEINRFGSDVVVLATGSRWDTSGFSPAFAGRATLPGHEQSNVFDVETATELALADGTALGKKVIIAEEAAIYLPLGLAEVLAQSGVEVEVISPDLFVGEQVNVILEDKNLMPRLTDLGVVLTAQKRVDYIDDRVVGVRNVWSDKIVELRENVDSLVLSLMRTPVQSFNEQDIVAQVISIGDVVAPRDITEVMVEAEKLGREL